MSGSNVCRWAGTVAPGRKPLPGPRRPVLGPAPEVERARSRNHGVTSMPTQPTCRELSMPAILTAPAAAQDSAAAHGQPSAFATTGPWAALPPSARRLAAAIARSCRQAAQRRALQALDNATLRDIGLARCEIDSIVAEGNGIAEPTRLRAPTHPVTRHPAA